MNASPDLAGMGMLGKGPREHAPPKVKRVVVSKYASRACVQCRKACVCLSLLSVSCIELKLDICDLERRGVKAASLFVSGVRGRDTRFVTLYFSSNSHNRVLCSMLLH